MSKKIFIISFIIIISFLLIAPSFIFAAEEVANPSPTQSQILNNTKAVGDSAGYANATKDSFVIIVAKTVKILLSFLGIIFLILTLISGFQWMTAQGNEDAVKKAKSRLKNAIIGLIITVLSFTISYYLFAIIWQSVDSSVEIPL